MSCCRKWRERLALAAGGDLDPAGRIAVDRHVAGCAQCAETLAKLEETLEWLQAAHTRPIPEAHLAAVRSRVLAELDARPRRRWWWLALPAAVALCALLLALPWVRPAPVAPPPLVASAAPGVPALPTRNLSGQTKTHHPRRAPRHHRAVAIVPEPPAESITVKLVTDDPNVVIYWLGDPK
jgi:anti-sigma factor RsiW